MTEALDNIRTSYDTVATSYAERVVEGPEWEVAAFDHLIRPAAGRPILDAGCGPGRTTALLTERSHPTDSVVVGLDLSPGMIGIARRSHPELDFRVGSMTALDFPDEFFGGVLSWWSIIHLPRELVPVALGEFYRVLAPGGVLLLGFHLGEGSTHKTSGYGGLAMDVQVHRWRPEELVEKAVAVGFTPCQTDLPEDCVVVGK
ncbi:class I SAM-dependent methyltransferase [Kribbella sandramycini]|uniref:Class I SAM-dependent methyltransferase n=1 Tax=Kribbella sandramycini TaxID=60450 RepID=A0A7Y4P086_9ACTN|nr:class I SAM-dependent methyltransferase [Kribbella sandramycini]MBB6565374.1 ubiquinone/menaquinone biosynthesis C-methylase UbiE [Kribbella sandramycini]NOL41643.1 class I SAM-dependent methyltransferase [Kribbella sandramycini]